MKKKSTIKVGFHCDGFYSACENRGFRDSADVKKRAFCESGGQYTDRTMCRHCVELKSRFRNKPQKRIWNSKKK